MKPIREWVARHRRGLRWTLNAVAALLYAYVTLVMAGSTDFAIRDLCDPTEGYVYGEDSFCDFAKGEDFDPHRGPAHDHLFWTPAWVCAGGLVLAILTRRAIVMHVVCGLSTVAAIAAFLWAVL